MRKNLCHEKTNQKTQNLITIVSANDISLAENLIVKFIQIHCRTNQSFEKWSASPKN